MSIAENLREINARIERSAKAAGRDARDILLIGATKMNDAGRVQEAISAGLRACGENRVQELSEKLAQNAYDGAELHFIGHLQRNKVKQVVGKVKLIHSVDSLNLMDAISAEAVKQGLTQDILIELNLAGELSKSGFSEAELPSALAHAADLDGIRVRGLMSIPPICAEGAENLPYFRSLEQLFIDNRGKKYDNVYMDFLSMGMSGDFECAIACGANMIRLGTAIFGRRVYPEKP